MSLRPVLIKSEGLLWGEEAFVATGKTTTQWCPAEQPGSYTSNLNDDDDDNNNSSNNNMNWYIVWQP